MIFSMPQIPAAGPDVSGLNHARGASEDTGPSPAPGLAKACQEFEAMFVETILKQARESALATGLLDDSPQSELYQGMLDTCRARSMAEKGLGLARTMMEQLQGRTAYKTTDGS